MVRYFTTPIPGDRNYRNQHAEVDGIKFCAFPFQSYYARVGNTSAQVGKVAFAWSASIWECHPDGRSTAIVYQRFDSKDEAFEWAAAQIKEREG